MEKIDKFENMVESSEDDIDTIFQAELDKIRNGTQKIDEENSINNNNRDLVFHSKVIGSQPSILNGLIEWPVSMYRWTFQVVAEGLGLSSQITQIDENLNEEIKSLKLLRKECLKLCSVIKKLSKAIEKMSKYENLIALEFSQFSINDTNSLSLLYENNSEILSSVHSNSKTLINSLNLFHSSIMTLCNQTIKDALWTMSQIQNIRFIYDGQREQCSKLELSKSCDNLSKLPDIKSEMDKSKLRFDRLNEDLRVKLTLLKDNKTNLFQTQLENLNNSISLFFSSKFKIL